MTAAPRWRVVARDGEQVVVVDLDDSRSEVARIRVPANAWPALASVEGGVATGDTTRWVWNDTTHWYPQVLAAGAVIARCHDLRLCHAILRDSTMVVGADDLRAATSWDAGAVDTAGTAAAVAPTLFDLDASATPGGAALPADIDAVLAEFRRQQDALGSATDPARLRLLLAAESAGALLAAELHAAGLPWRRGIHERILEDVLGERGPAGGVPTRIREVGAVVRAALEDPAASLDSQPKLLRSLHRVGVMAQSTSRWELAEYDHAVIAPLLEYKKLTRLASANGWAWLEEWAPAGRFRPVYVPGGVVTGRGASSGGGGLQLPPMRRPALHADDGWTLVVADAAQLEPRVLAAMAGDLQLADAARGRDLYDGIVSSGTVSTRAEAKVAMLGAMYGATTGDSGRLVPALRRAYPRAMALVDDAARVGDDGGVVTTWLGRSSPPPSERWRELQGQASDSDASEADQTRARRASRDRGRFTRNFVVQGTAAEWALAWLAGVRTALQELPECPTAEAAVASGAVFSRRAHLCFFLHDEIIVHTPAAHADRVAEIVRSAAASAAHLLFGGFPIDFPLDLRITPDAGNA